MAGGKLQGRTESELTSVAWPDSFLKMIREQALRARQKLVSKLPITGEILRGSLLERSVRHTKDCPKCAVAKVIVFSYLR